MEHSQTDEIIPEFTHSSNAEIGLREEADRLVNEEGLSEGDAIRVAAMTMDGAGEGETVESMQTCRNLFKEPVKGLTTDDIPSRRRDKYAMTETKRHTEAEIGVDLAAIWMTLSKISDDGLEVANRLAAAVDEDETQLERFQDLIFVTAVEKKFTDVEVVELLKKTLEESK